MTPALSADIDERATDAPRPPVDDAHPGVGRVLLLEPNAALRSAILTVLSAEEYEVQTCDSLAQVVEETDGDTSALALVAWQSMDGLLAEERRDRLAELTQRLRLVLMVPRRWARLLEQTDLQHYVAGLIAKPFQADDLLQMVQHALT